MMSSVKYHFGVMRTAKSAQKDNSTLQQEATQFSLDEEEDGYSTILGANYMTNGAGGASSRLLRNDGANDGERNMEQPRKKSGGGQQLVNGSAKLKGNGHGQQKGNGNVLGGLHLERKRGPTNRMRTSTSKCSSLLTDEVELDDVEEEDDPMAGHLGSDDDEDDLLPNFGTSNGIGAQNGTQLGQMNGAFIGTGMDTGNGTWQRWRRRFKLFACCLPLRRTGGGFSQFK